MVRRRLYRTYTDSRGQLSALLEVYQQISGFLCFHTSSHPNYWLLPFLTATSRRRFSQGFGNDGPRFSLRNFAPSTCLGMILPLFICSLCELRSIAATVLATTQNLSTTLTALYRRTFQPPVAC